MLKKILPLLFLLIGTGAGVGAGLLVASKHPGTSPLKERAEQNEVEKPAELETEYVKLNNQFVVPIVESERVTSLVVLSLSLETKVPMREQVYLREPKLRDVFLQTLFDHANIGGFNGSFTQSDTLDLLRSALKDVAQNELGDDVTSVLILDIARQDN